MNSRDTKNAAAELGMTNRQLLAMLRNLNWIHNAPHSKRHNLPYRAYEIKGLLTTQDKYYKTKSNPTVLRLYQTVLITNKGLTTLKDIIEKGEAENQTNPPTTDSAQEEHDKCLEQLREWGLAS